MCECECLNVSRVSPAAFTCSASVVLVIKWILLFFFFKKRWHKNLFLLLKITYYNHKSIAKKKKKCLNDLTQGLHYFVGWLGHSRFHSSATRGRILVLSFIEKLGFNTMTWTMYLRSCGVESQVGPSSGDVIYFMKRKFRRCAIFIQPHTHYAGQTDTFECFPWGEGEDEEDGNCSSSYDGWTLWWISLCRASWRKKGVGLKAAHHFLFVLSHTFWKTLLQCSLS